MIGRDYGLMDALIVRECEIDGKRVTYDGCASGTLDDAKDFYLSINNGASWEYIGSSDKGLWINGKRQFIGEMNHFFNRKGWQPK